MADNNVGFRPKRMGQRHNTSLERKIVANTVLRPGKIPPQTRPLRIPKPLITDNVKRRANRLLPKTKPPEGWG